MKNLPVSSPNMIVGNVSGGLTSDNFTNLKSSSNISRMNVSNSSSLGGVRDNDYNSGGQMELNKQNMMWQKKQLVQKNLLESAFKKKILPIDSCHLR